MAITINTQPYTWTPRGQKLIYDLSSDNTGNTGFKFGISVLDNGTGKTYEFYLDAAPDGRAYFDLNPLVNLRNNEATAIHSQTAAQHTEPEGDSWKSYDLTFTEWWLVAGVLTENEGVSETATTAVYNGYLQPIDGYRPNVFSSSDRIIKIAVNNTADYLQSDRRYNTHTWAMAESFGITPSTDTVFIPAFNTDWGLLFLIGDDEYCTPNTATKYRVELFNAAGAPSSASVTFTPSPQVGIPCFPANLINSTVPSMPDPSASGWRYYRIFAMNTAENRISKLYYFYNAEEYGQYDCRYNYVRLAWVNSRGGWDYQNFIKKNEITNNIERKQFKRVLYNGTSSIFSRFDRQKFDRQNIVTQTLTITSDWIQENEFVFLRSLMASNEVQIVLTDGTQVPVSMDENSFLERKERNGKLYNVTFKITYSQDYWS
jgi:hypothetical protein